MATILEYQRRTHFPTYSGNLRLRVDADGGVYLQRNLAEPPGGREWVEDYPAEPTRRVPDAARRVAKLLQRGGFFKMEPRYESPNSTDGGLQTLRYQGEAGERTVTVDRARVKDFSALVQQLFRELGLEQEL